MLNNMIQSDLNFNPMPKYIKQWVNNVIGYSSQYNSTTWAANKVIGPPMVYPGYGDLHNTWAQGSHSASEFIELEFPTELIVMKLNIYETFHAGAITTIKLKNKENWELVYGPTHAQDINQSRIFSPELRKINFKTNKVRLELDCTCSNSWCEIDAIEMIGKLPIDVNECEKELSIHMKNMLLSKEFFDIEFKIEDKFLSAHRNILATRSQYFKGLLCENLKPNRLTKPIYIEHLSYNAFYLLIMYLYTNRIEENTNPIYVCELLRKGNIYNIESLNASVIEFINEVLDKDNVLKIYKYSSEEEPELIEIKELCLKFISNHFYDIVKNQEFKNLEQKSIITITQFYAKDCHNKI